MFFLLIQKIAQPIFGVLEPEEFKKFTRMGLVRSCILGAYWVLLVLKNALFCQLVGPAFGAVCQNIFRVVLGAFFDDIQQAFRCLFS